MTFFLFSFTRKRSQRHSGLMASKLSTRKLGSYINSRLCIAERRNNLSDGHFNYLCLCFHSSDVTSVNEGGRLIFPVWRHEYVPFFANFLLNSRVFTGYHILLVTNTQHLKNSVWEARGKLKFWWFTRARPFWNQLLSIVASAVLY